VGVYLILCTTLSAHAARTINKHQTTTKMAIIIGKKMAMGLDEPKPLKGFPSGKIRIRQRQTDMVTVCVKTEDGIREFFVEDKDGFWNCSYERARNSRHNVEL
jgi:hypothetical protein